MVFDVIFSIINFVFFFLKFWNACICCVRLALWTQNTFLCRNQNQGSQIYRLCSTGWRSFSILEHYKLFYPGERSKYYQGRDFFQKWAGHLFFCRFSLKTFQEFCNNFEKCASNIKCGCRSVLEQPNLCKQKLQRRTKWSSATPRKRTGSARFIINLFLSG